jgi:isoleucyl-tRNA synthetase
VRRKFFGTLYNTYSFFGLYANIDGFKYEEGRDSSKRKTKLINGLSLNLTHLIKDVDGFMLITNLQKQLVLFLNLFRENLSNWYVRLCRRRFWKGICR